jgi:hypothetical protein
MADDEEVPAAKPQYKVNDILVSIIKDGRSTCHYFYRVKGITKTGAPRVVQLAKRAMELFSDPGEDMQIVTPNTKEEVGNMQCMHWYRNWGYYFTKEDHATVRAEGGAYGTTKMYDAGETYKDHWLSD